MTPVHLRGRSIPSRKASARVLRCVCACLSEGRVGWCVQWNEAAERVCGSHVGFGDHCEDLVLHEMQESSF